MISKIDMTRKEIIEDGKKGFVIDGTMMGTGEGCIDILAYCVINLARNVKRTPPEVLMKLLKRVQYLDKKGVGKDYSDVVAKVEMPVDLLDVLRKNNAEDKENDQ